MSLTKCKRRRRLKIPEKNISDVTLNDFANSDKAAKSEVYRKKCGLKELIEEVKSLTLNIENDTVEEDNDPQITKLPRKRRTKNESNAGEEIAPITGVSEELLPATIYPLDLWFIIGEYIRPEDVGRFASICTSSRAVVSSPDFWLRLRRRYVGRAYGGEKNNYALRPLVIRALKQSYEPLLARSQFFVRSQTVGVRHTSGGNLANSANILRNCSSLEGRGAAKVQSTMVQRRRLRFLGDHHLVLGAYCVQAWQEKNKGSWIYYIKLKHLTGVDGVTLHGNVSAGEGNEPSIVKDDGTPDCWMSIGEESLGCEDDEQKKQIGDMWANSEEGCKVIEIVLDKEQITRGHVGPCPQILGLSLVWACARQVSTTSASSNSRHLALLFGPPHLSPRAATSLLSKLSSDWESCGGGWAEPASEAEEIALACGTPTPKGSKCGVLHQSCCKGGRGVSSWVAATHPNGMVPVVIPSVNAIRLLDWWDADYPYPGEVKNGGGAACSEEGDHRRWMF